MSSIISHPFIPMALTAAFPPGTVSSDVALLGVLCSIVPDLDVIGFLFGIRYADRLGHRGLTHSVFFAISLSALLAFFFFQDGDGSRAAILLFLFLSTLSHPLLDAMTDGGLGVAFFAPFDHKRYFLPWRPIAVPPIGIGAFFSARGWQVMKSELRWIWLPSIAMFLIAHMLRW